MSTFAVVGESTALRRAAVRATRAPSVCNSQPWTMHLRAGRLDVFADRSRKLTVLDPVGRQLVISCGCAILNARVALAAAGLGVDVQHRPDPTRPDLLATLLVTDAAPDQELAALDRFVEPRHRRATGDDPVSPAVLAALTAAARHEGADLTLVDGAEQRAVVADATAHADEIAALNPAYRAELKAWAIDDVAPWQRPAPPGELGLLLLGTTDDSAADWLHAGEALQRVLLEVARHGYAAALVSRLTEVPSARARLRDGLDLPGHPHVLLYLGRGPATPSLRRRRLVDVLVDET